MNPFNPGQPWRLLGVEVNQLRENIQHLKQERSSLATRIRDARVIRNTSVADAVEQYFAMFANGLHDPNVNDLERQCHDIQVQFLHAFMAQDVQIGASAGIDAVLKQWWQYANYHSTVVMELGHVDVVGPDTSPIAKAMGRLTLGLTRATIENVFPHLVDDTHLTQLLVGQEIKYPTCTEFVFNTNLQVARLDFGVDFVSGLNALLPTAELTVYVLDRAMITDDGFLGPLTRRVGCITNEPTPRASHEATRHASQE